MLLLLVTATGHLACHTVAQAAEQGDGEWVAIHCGANKEHVKNKALMASVRGMGVAVMMS